MAVRNQRGASLIELIFAIAIMLTLGQSFYQLLITFFQSYRVQSAVAEMQQQGRVASDLIFREIQLAGYDPTGSLFLADRRPNPDKKTKSRKVGCVTGRHPAEEILEATPALFHFLADLNANGVVDDGKAGARGGDGAPGGPDIDEDIRYEWIDSSGIDSCKKNRRPLTLYRDGGSGGQEVASNVEELRFLYFDAEGELLPDGALSAAQRAAIKKVAVRLTVRTDRKDPRYSANGGYRTRVFTTEVWLKNLQ